MWVRISLSTRKLAAGMNARRLVILKYERGVLKMEKPRWQLIPCDKDCYYQRQGYCELDDIACITSFEDSGCGYFTRTDPYALFDERDGL